METVPKLILKMIEEQTEKQVKKYNTENPSDLITQYGAGLYRKLLEDFLKKNGTKGFNSQDEVDIVFRNYNHEHSVKNLMLAIVYYNLSEKIDKLEKKIDELRFQKPSKKSTKKSKNNWEN